MQAIMQSNLMTHYFTMYSDHPDVCLSDVEEAIEVGIYYDRLGALYGTPKGSFYGAPYGDEMVFSVMRGKESLLPRYIQDETFRHAVDSAVLKEMSKLNESNL